MHVCSYMLYASNIKHLEMVLRFRIRVFYFIFRDTCSVYKTDSQIDNEYVFGKETTPFKTFVHNYNSRFYLMESLLSNDKLENIYVDCAFSKM